MSKVGDVVGQLGEFASSTAESTMVKAYFMVGNFIKESFDV